MYVVVAVATAFGAWDEVVEVAQGSAKLSKAR